MDARKVFSRRLPTCACKYTQINERIIYMKKGGKKQNLHAEQSYNLQNWSELFCDCEKSFLQAVRLHTFRMKYECNLLQLES